MRSKKPTAARRGGVDERLRTIARRGLQPRKADDVLASNKKRKYLSAHQGCPGGPRCRHCTWDSVHISVDGPHAKYMASDHADCRARSLVRLDSATGYPSSPTPTPRLFEKREGK